SLRLRAMEARSDSFAPGRTRQRCFQFCFPLRKRRVMTPKLLCVEDEKTREKLARGLRNDFDVEVYAPKSFKEFKERVLLEKPDGAVIDIRLREWGITETNKQRLDGFEIGNGLDISRFLYK